MTIKEKFSSIDQSKLTAEQKSFLSKIKNVTKNFSIEDKDVNDKVEGALDKMITTLKDKMPEAIKSTSTARPKKRSVMSVAKDIRKDGEDFTEAKKRATKKIAEDKESAKKTIKSELDKLNDFIKSRKTLSDIKGTNLLRDAKRKAKPVGRRLSKSGNVYYEYRDSKTDRLSPNYPKNAPYLAGGGELKKGDILYVNMGNGEGVERVKIMNDFKAGMSAIKFISLQPLDKKSAPYTITNTKLSKVIVNKDLFELGGSVVTDLAGHTGGSFGTGNKGMLDGFSNTAYSGLVGETGAMSSGEMFEKGGKLYDRKKDWINYDKDHLMNKNNGMIVLKTTNINEIMPKDIKGFDRLYNYANGGSVGMANQQVIDDASQGYVNYYLGEGASTGIYKNGGAIENQYAGKTPEEIWNMLSISQRYHFLHDHKKEIESTPASVEKATKTAYKFLPEKIKISFKKHIEMGQYARGGSIKNERKHVNKAEDYEVRYSKPRPSRKGYLGKRDFAGGGSLTNEFKEVEDFGSEQYFIRDFGHVIIEDDKKIELVVVARLIDLEDFMSEDEIPSEGKYQLDFDLVPKGKYLSKSRKNEVNDEDNSISSVTEINVVNYMGGLRFEPSDKTFFKTFELAKKHLMSKELNDKITGMGVMSGFIMDMPYNRMGKTNWEQLNYILGLTDSYAKGGGVRKVGNREYSYGRNWTNDHRHVNDSEEHEVKYTRKGKFLGIFNNGGAVEDNFLAKRENIIEKINEAERNYSKDNGKAYNDARREMQEHRKLYYEKLNESERNFSKDNGAEYNRLIAIKDFFNKGGSVTNERLHVNKGEDYEVRYSKPRPARKGYLGKRDFMAGGMVETPKIYVADLEAYNNGRLVGEWLDLTDYNDADELMEAIQNVLKKSGGEEYAIHDYEYLPSSMYSEYMGYKDFVEIYEMMDLAKEKDLPLDVVMDIVSQFDRSALDDFQGVYNSEEDFAEELVDETGITNFNDFRYYLEISETDRRLLAQEEADYYADAIRDEDGGNRLIEEADLDVEEYEEADSERQEEMLDEAREVVYDRIYDRTYDGLDDPYSYFVEELGSYDKETFANLNFVRIDYEKLADALEDDYTFVRHDGQIYVFNIR
jgi:antirestriction protein